MCIFWQTKQRIFFPFFLGERERESERGGIYEAMAQIRMHRTFAASERAICTWRVENESHSAKLWAPPRRQWKRPRRAQRGTEAGRQAPKPWRGAFWHNDSHLPLTGLRKVKLIMTARRCWIAFDEVNHRQSKKTGVERFLIHPLKLYRAQTPLFKILFSLFFFPLVSVPHKATISLRFAASLPLFWLFSWK